MTKENMVEKATLILALTAFIQALVAFKDFSKDVNDWSSLLVLGLIGIVLMVIAYMAGSIIPIKRKK
ncbi:MAG: hypothetical protein NTU57_00695 [Candidatus Aenigmarchaeota archaeon]|nr:hypothetical protein [Candidatus Aenigmarchaeota archaeon]